MDHSNLIDIDDPSQRAPTHNTTLVDVLQGRPHKADQEAELNCWVDVGNFLKYKELEAYVRFID